ncbi:MAG: metallophosphoesterase [Gemmataceae bacterium]
MTWADLCFALAAVVCWIGHAYIWTGILNHLYGRPLPKWFLKPWRLFTGAVILSLPLIYHSSRYTVVPDIGLVPVGIWSTLILQAYLPLCLLYGGWVFPVVTVSRLLTPKPRAVVHHQAEEVDLWKQLGPAAIGDGKYRHVARLPFNDVFRVEFTDLTLAVPKLPAAWDGLRIDFLSDLHFCGTPSRAFFDAVMDKLTAGPPPDLVVLGGDFVDTDAHHAWLAPVLGRLTATEGKYAIVGNHDQHHHPDRVRAELIAAGYTVLGNGWREATIRGERCVLVGHEGPWFRPAPGLKGAPADCFRLCVSHTPDNFYWGVENRIGLMLCGHVHGGQIRLPLIGSIFVPSVYGRRFDQGVFESEGMVMAVGRGVSGKEPLRFRCRPQVLRLTLTAGRPA